MLVVFLLLCCRLSWSQISTAEKVFDRCWASADFMTMLDEPTCHLAWLTHLKTAPVVAIDYAAPLGGEHDGSLRLVLGGANVTVHAMFKPCSAARRAIDPTRELLAYHIDRQLLIHRVPATVMRRFTWAELFATRPFGAIRDTMAVVQQQCSGHDPAVVTGLVQGWTKFDIKLLDRVDRDLESEIWRQRTPSLYQIELSRLFISLYVLRIESDVFQHVAELDEPFNAEQSAVERRRLLMGIERGHATWDSAVYKAPGVREQPCQRTHEASQFRCQLYASADDAPEVLAGRVLMFLRTACFFPLKVAGRLQQHGSKWSTKLSSLVEEEMRKAGRDVAAKPPPGYSAAVLDERIEQLADVVEQCLKVYGGVEVAFED